jgi:hypothetical protein
MCIVSTDTFCVTDVRLQPASSSAAEEASAAAAEGSGSSMAPSPEVQQLLSLSVIMQQRAVLVTCKSSGMPEAISSAALRVSGCCTLGVNGVLFVVVCLTYC